MLKVFATWYSKKHCADIFEVIKNLELNGKEKDIINKVIFYRDAWTWLQFEKPIYKQIEKDCFKFFRLVLKKIEPFL